MMSDAGVDHAAEADRLGVSSEAVALTHDAEVFDLHLETFLWPRLLPGWDPVRRHGTGVFDARYGGQTDVPRLLEAGVDAAHWSIATNPLRSAAGRERTFHRNLARLRGMIEAHPNLEHVRTATEHRKARDAGRHAAWIAIQGGNALDHDVDAVTRIPDDSVCRITLVHLSTSSLGKTSAPDPLHRGSAGLTDLGRRYVEACDSARILVDLAHIHPEAFWDAVEVHDASLPLIDTHTGVDAVTLHWRNIDDDQILAIARTGGTIGVIFACQFLGAPYWGGPAADLLLAHLTHIIDVAGEDHASLGTDWDGFIITPRDMPTCLDLPVLTQKMLDAGWAEDRIRKVLGGNALRVMETIRP
ncbi:MAG: membrane dipeptidase [Acidimicrobiia bacterium]|nr:membrane dipeptidase [Acidimicrobiia bacterium]